MKDFILMILRHAMFIAVSLAILVLMLLQMKLNFSNLHSKHTFYHDNQKAQNSISKQHV